MTSNNLKQYSLPWGKRWRPRLFLLLGASAAALVIAEGMLRLIAPNVRLPFQVNILLENERGKFCKYDALLGWIGRPDVNNRFVSLDCAHEVRQNRYGFRGVAYPFMRGPKQRLLVMGDSFAWGYGVEESDLFTTRVEQRAMPPTEVANLGVSGYGTDQELLLYREFGRRLKADRVLLVVTPYTDLWDNTTATLYDDYPKPMFRINRDGGEERLELTNVPVPQRSEPWTGGTNTFTATTPMLCRLAARSSLMAATINALAANPSVRVSLESRRILPARQGGDDSELWIHVSSVPPEVEQACDVLFALIREFNAEIGRDGASLTILLVPSVVDVDAEMWEDMRVRIGKARRSLPPGAAPDRDQIRRRVVKFCAENGIDLIDPTDALRQAAERNRYVYFPWNGHWTPTGHELIARILLKQLSEGSFVRPSPGE